MAYRITPHSTTGVSPSEALLGRRLRSRLDLVVPVPARRVEEKQWSQKANYDVKAKARSFNTGDWVLVRNHSSGDKWLPGTITKQTGPVSYQVEVEGTVRRCHVDQLKRRSSDGHGQYMNVLPSGDDMDFPVREEEIRIPPMHGSTNPSNSRRSYPIRTNRGVPPDRYSPGTN